MKLIDRIAVHAFVKSIMDFIIKIMEIFNAKKEDKTVIDTDKKKRPFIEKLKKWLS